MGPHGGPSYYAEAVNRGSRLEIPLFSGDDALDWIQQCDKFFDISGTSPDQWVNLAVAHLYGRAGRWYREIGIPWQMIS